jgi:hypothetical protein
MRSNKVLSIKYSLQQRDCLVLYIVVGIIEVVIPVVNMTSFLLRALSATTTRRPAATGRRSALAVVLFSIVVVVVTVALVEAFVPSRIPTRNDGMTTTAAAAAAITGRWDSTFSIQQRSRSRNSNTNLLSTTINSSSDVTITPPPKQQSSANTVICGGGPAGLLTSIMLAQKFPNQKVSE